MNYNSTPIAAERPEFALLLCCARTRAEPLAFARIDALLKMPLNWDAVLAMAERHGLASLLYWRLNRDFSQAAPEDVLGLLRQGFDHRVRRNLFLAGELLSLLRLFESQGVEAIPWKGPTLAVCAYGNLALRNFCDLDILVREQDLQTASQLLRSKDYEPLQDFTARQEKTYLGSRDEYAFINGREGVMVELHWAIVPKAYSFRFQIDHLWNRPAAVSIAGASVRGMRPEILLLSLCVHGSKHCWERLGWVCDISEVVGSHENLDWDNISTLARTSHANRMLLLGLVLAHELFGANIPESMIACASADRRVMKLAEEVTNGFFQERSFHTGDRNGSGSNVGRSSETRSGVVAGHSHWRALLFQLQLMEDFRDRLRYIAWQVVPTAGDWTLIHLPDFLFPMYYVIRPFRLAAKYGLRALRRKDGA